MAQILAVALLNTHGAAAAASAAGDPDFKILPAHICALQDLPPRGLADKACEGRCTAISAALGFRCRSPTMSADQSGRTPTSVCLHR